MDSCFHLSNKANDGYPHNMDKSQMHFAAKKKAASKKLPTIRFHMWDSLVNQNWRHEGQSSDCQGSEAEI